MSEIDTNNTMLPHEAADYLDISIQKLARLRRQGIIQGEKVPGVNLSTFKLEELRKIKGKIKKKEKPGPKPKEENP